MKIMHGNDVLYDVYMKVVFIYHNQIDIALPNYLGSLKRLYN